MPAVLGGSGSCKQADQCLATCSIKSTSDRTVCTVPRAAQLRMRSIQLHAR